MTDTDAKPLPEGIPRLIGQLESIAETIDHPGEAFCKAEAKAVLLAAAEVIRNAFK